MNTAIEAHYRLREAYRADRAVELPVNFMRFVYDAPDLDLAVDPLVFCEAPQSGYEVTNRCVQCGADQEQIGRVLHFLTDQDLVIIDKGKFKTIEKAVNELIHRLEHDGLPSPREPVVDPYESKRQQARDKVNKTLRANGYHTTAGRPRMRVVG